MMIVSKIHLICGSYTFIYLQINMEVARSLPLFFHHKQEEKLHRFNKFENYLFLDIFLIDLRDVALFLIFQLQEL